MGLIPVIAVPTLYRTDLLFRFLKSIDYPVQTKLIIDNGGLVPETDEAHVVRLPHNIGVAASWNLIMKLTPRAGWWFICNDDIAFNPGELERVAQVMEDPSPKIGMLLGFAAFAINQRALERTGYFDENFVPAYCEDNDMSWRAKQAGVPLVEIEGDPVHEGSATINGHELYMMQNGTTFTRNLLYYAQKWGGRPGQEVFTTPFDQGGDIGAVRLEAERLATQAWARLKPGR